MSALLSVTVVSELDFHRLSVPASQPESQELNPNVGNVIESISSCVYVHRLAGVETVLSRRTISSCSGDVAL